MTFSEFTEIIKNEAERELGVELCLMDVTKYNEIYKGMVFANHEELKATPIVNMTKLFDQYHGVDDFGKIFDSVLSVLKMPKQSIDFNLKKEDVVFRVRRKDNEEKDHPFYDCGNGLIMTYHIIVETEMGDGSIWVSNDIMKNVLKTTREELYGLALANTVNKFPPMFGNMSLMLFCGNNIPFEETLETIDSCEPMYVLTNIEKLFGASVIYYPTVLKKISEKLGEFYILPSSVHEVIIVPSKTFDADVNVLKQMVMEVNATEVAPNELLSNNVYKYDIESDKIVKIV